MRIESRPKSPPFGRQAARRRLQNIDEPQPGKLVYGSGGAGQASHLNGEKFRLAAGINVVNVPFKAGADSLIETLAGRVHYCFSGLAPALPFVKEGKLLALAVTTPHRAPMLPDVPTIAK